MIARLSKTRPNAFGESFRVGDEVAVRPDCANFMRDFGVVTALGEYGPYHVIVRWREGYCGDLAHIDRIALR